MSEQGDSGRVVWAAGDSWRLRVETVTRPDGESEERGYVVHPGSVVLAPVVRVGPDGPEMVVLRQQRTALGEQLLELPAGTRGWDEPWLDCAQRELREETGYRAARFIPLGEILPAPGYSGERMALYLATGLTSDPLPADFDEALAVETIALARLAAMAVDGRLRDAKSVVAILRAATYYGGESAPR